MVGEVRVCIPSVASYGRFYPPQLFNETYHPVLKGNVTEAQPIMARDKGYTRTFRAQNVPPRPQGPLVLAEELPVADLYMVPTWFTWKKVLSSFYTHLEDVEPPKQFFKSAKDTLAKATDLERVLAISRYLDDPDNFQLTRTPREIYIVQPDLEQTVRDRRGDGFDKAVLAYSVLRKLGTKCNLVFGCSQYVVKPDWRIFDPKFLNAALILVPGAGENFIWD